MERLRAAGELALWVALEPARIASDVESAELIVIERIAAASMVLAPGTRTPPSQAAHAYAPGSRLERWLRDSCAAVRPRRVVLLLDETDGLQAAPLLTQLRAGSPDRVQGLVRASVGLVGLRNLRDCVVEVRGGTAPGPTSPFNVLLQSFLLGNFRSEEIASLCAQHTADTGQAFTEAALDRVWHWTRG